ncbi:MAG: FAD-dependent oxidoreductase [Pseudomonadota bacterium]
MKRLDMDAEVLIIGGGIAGLWCGRELARRGIGSVIVEKAPHLGGHVADFACKATRGCQRCGACLLEDAMESVTSSSHIKVMTRTELTRVSGVGKRFETTLFRRPKRVHVEGTDNASALLDLCPNPPALIQSPFDRGLDIDEKHCLFFVDGSCKECLDRLPSGSVDLETAAVEVPVTASAVVAACGFKVFDPHEKPRFGYGRVSNVLTAHELESLLRYDEFGLNGRSEGPGSVAFIQCVGSRDVRIGRNYCSRVCCGYALRLARLLRYKYPGTESSIFFMDIQTFERNFETRFREARDEVRLVRGIPSEVKSGQDGRPVLVYTGADESRKEEAFDLVVLSVGMSPDPAVTALGRQLGMGVNGEGFLGSDLDDVATDAPGVFTAGAVQGPRSIEQTVSHAIRAAGSVAAYISARG